MKKVIIFISSLLIFVSSLCYAQEGSKTYVGVKGGYNAFKANVYHQVYGYIADIGASSGYQYGMVMMHFLKPHYGVQMELNYTQKGYVQRFKNSPDFKTNFDYIELPFLVNVHTGQRNLHIFINAGLFIEYLVRLEEGELPVDVGDADFHPYDQDRDPKFGYGYRGGLGVFYDFKFGTLMFETNFSYSLSNFLDPTTFDTGIPDISNNTVWAFTVGYLFSFSTSK